MEGLARRIPPCGDELLPNSKSQRRHERSDPRDEKVALVKKTFGTCMYDSLPQAAGRKSVLQVTHASRRSPAYISPTRRSPPRSTDIASGGIHIAALSLQSLWRLLSFDDSADT